MTEGLAFWRGLINTELAVAMAAEKRRKVKMDEKLRKALVGSLLRLARELVQKAWEDHGGSLPQPAYEAVQSCLEGILEAELQVLRWDAKS